MSTGIHFKARTLCDVTSVRSEDLQKTFIGMNSPSKLVGNVDPSLKPASCHVICVASGKGGTGKSLLTTNLAVLLAKEGLKTLLFDADLGLANAHILLGVTPTHDISSVINGQLPLSDVVVDCGNGLQMISGGSGFSELSELNDSQLRSLAYQIEKMEEANDVILIDLSAGISPQVVRFLNASHDTILVTTPDATAMLDAYATIKVMKQLNDSFAAKIVINRAKDREDAVNAFKKIQGVAAKHLGNVDISFLGWVPQNFYMQDSVFKREPVVKCHSRSFATACLKQIAERVKSEHLSWKETVGDTPSFSSNLKQVVFE